MEKPLFTLDELAKRWQLNRRTLLSQCQRGDIPALKLGKEWRVSAAFVEAAERGEVVTDPETGRLLAFVPQRQDGGRTFVPAFQAETLADLEELLAFVRQERERRGRRG